MATKLTHPNEWQQFLLMCEAENYDSSMFDYYRDMFFGASKTKDEPVEMYGNTKRVKVTKPDGTTEIFKGAIELAKKLGRHQNYISQRNGKVVERGKLKGWRFDVMPKPIAVYALYEGDDLMGIGTAEELSEKYGLAVRTIEYYNYQKNRDTLSRHALLIDWEHPELEIDDKDWEEQEWNN